MSPPPSARSPLRIRFLAAASICLVCLLCLVARADDRSAAFRAALDSIRQDDLKRHVDYLADDAREGREAGTRGGKAAGDYIAAELARLRIPPAGTQDFGQMFPPNFRNILAMIEGRDPKLKNEVIVIGAHYDHVGYGQSGNSFGPAGYIHNGADDNASGVAGLLSAAQALAMLPERPRRSVLLAFWDAEERGMLGSKHWTAHSTVALDRVVFYFNLDMIGRLRSDRLVVLGTRSACGLRRLVSEDNEDPSLWFDFTWRMAPEADHHVFYSREIPVLALHTDLHEQFHRPTDKAALINAEGMRRIVRLLFCLADDLAERDTMPKFRPASRQETESTRQSWEGYRPVLPDRPLRVGISWRLDDAEPDAAVVTAVAPGSPAARAGIEVGDRIYRVDGRDFTSDAEFGRQLRTLPGPVRLQIEHRGRVRTVEIHFDSQPLQRAA